MHPIQPLIQEQVIDVATWTVDEHAVYPQGARPKSSCFAPDDTDNPVLRPGKRYLFKRSKNSYPDHFWIEIAAYRVGCALGVPVPPAFAAMNTTTGECGALIEWFYDESTETLVHGGDLLQRKLQPNIDRKTASNHNLSTNISLLRSLVFKRQLQGDWRQWLVDTFLFDALIGNTDRHQDNWGMIFWSLPTGEPQCRPTPHFDNGTSMGHERFPALVAGWSPEQWTRYVAKGKQRISIHLNPFAFAKHHELLVHCFEKYPKTRKVANARLALLPADFRPMFTDMLKLICPEPFTPGRAMICSSLLTIRTQQLRALLE